MRRLSLSTFGSWTWRAELLRDSRLAWEATYIQSGRPTAAASSSAQTEKGLGVSIRNHRAAPGAKKRCLNQASGNFFFQAEDGIRYLTVTGVQTCALPI